MSIQESLFEIRYNFRRNNLSLRTPPFLVFLIEYVFELPRLEMLIFSSLPFPSLSQEITFAEDVKGRRRIGEWGCSSSALRLITWCLGLLLVLK
jgi:hypothetical protein